MRSATIVNAASIVSRTVTVTVSGTPVQGPDIIVPGGFVVVCKGHYNNTGIITVASSSTDALNTSSNNHPLSQNQSLGVQVQNFNQLWFDASVSGEKVILTVEK